jgi:hypothetical protein
MRPRDPWTRDDWLVLGLLLAGLVLFLLLVWDDPPVPWRGRDFR